MKQTGFSKASVNSYLPYAKAIYNANEVSLNAKRLRKFRERQEAVNKVRRCMKEGTGDLCETVWNALISFEGYPFYTEKKHKYRYAVEGQELIIVREDIRIARERVEQALERVMQNRVAEEREARQAAGAESEYVYPVLRRLGMV